MRDTLAQKAHHQVNGKIKSGRLIRPSTCQRCGANDKPMRDGRTSIQAHHHNGYDNPLDVEWLCVKCHHDETPQPWGERAGHAKANWKLFDDIRSRYNGGEPYYRIAADIGLHPTTVHRIVTHRSWLEHTRHKSYRSALVDPEGGV